MHETGIVRDLVRRLMETARTAGAERVSGVTVRLGALSQFSAEHFREHFDEEAAGTLVAGAALTIETSDELLDPHAQHVIIRSVELDVPDDD